MERLFKRYLRRKHSDRHYINISDTSRTGADMRVIYTYKSKLFGGEQKQQIEYVSPWDMIEFVSSDNKVERWIRALSWIITVAVIVYTYSMVLWKVI